MQTKIIKSKIKLFLSKAKLASLSFAAAVVARGVLLPARVSATVVQEDFAYLSGGFVVQDNGGIGWLNGWSDNSARPGFASPSLMPYTVVNNGYAIVETNGAGYLWNGYGGQTPPINGYRGGMRAIETTAPMSNTVWFSFLMCISNSASGALVGFRSSNPYGSGSEYVPSTGYNIGVSNTTLVRTLGTTMVRTTNNTLALQTVHLVLGSIVFNASGNAQLQLWADPPDLTDLQPAQFSETAFNP